MSKIYLRLNGIPVDAITDASEVYFYREPTGAWYPSSGNLHAEIDAVCVELIDLFEEKIFGTREVYFDYFLQGPKFISEAGLNSESLLSVKDFALLVEKAPAEFPLNKMLYLFDCRKLVSGIQECIKEVLQLQGEFYQVLNLEELFYPKIKENDGLRFMTSPVVTKLFALLGFIYMRMHSLLDYATKLSIEFNKIVTCFDKYPRLVSKNKLYSARKELGINGLEGTLYEKCKFITEIETIRNHLIHDGVIDDMPKVYKVIEQGECVEKYVLFPDLDENGRFFSYKNRTLFYSHDDKGVIVKSSAREI